VNTYWFRFYLEVYQIVRWTVLPHTGVVLQPVGSAGVEIEGDASGCLHSNPSDVHPPESLALLPAVLRT
jgi:hypothetical protein